MAAPAARFASPDANSRDAWHATASADVASEAGALLRLPCCAAAPWGARMASGGVASALRRLASSFLTRCSAAAPDAEVLDYSTGVLEDGDVDVDALVRCQQQGARACAPRVKQQAMACIDSFSCVASNAFVDPCRLILCRASCPPLGRCRRRSAKRRWWRCSTRRCAPNSIHKRPSPNARSRRCPPLRHGPRRSRSSSRCVAPRRAVAMRPGKRSLAR